MPALPRCPSDDELQLLAVGKLPDPPAGEFEEHLLTCDNCAQRTVALQPEDPLVLALARGKPAPPDASAGGPDRLEELMDSLSGLFAAQSEDTQLSGPHDTQDVPLDLSQNVIQELSAAWRPAESADELGRIGHYRILKLLGAGGMGAVFLAEDLQLHRQVALKMMRPKAAVASGATERFLREARSAAALRHDHILTIYQVDEERGVPFLAMEYLEGESLEERLKRDPVLPLDQTLRIGREIAEGLAAAYAKGLIHRDIKPGNIWLEAGRDRVKILDFGLARLHQTDAQLTSSGMIVGTPAYMAPEQASGDPVDGRADLFSLGVIFYRMTTGTLPFPGRNALETLKSLATIIPASPKSLNPAIPSVLSDLIDQLLSKTPQDRPESAQSLNQRLAGIERELPTDLSTAAHNAAQPPHRLRAWKTISVLLGSSLLILLAVVVIKIRTNDGKETKVTVKVPGEVQSVGTEIQNTPKPAKTTKLQPAQVDEGPSIAAVQFDGVEDLAVVPSVSELPDEEWTMEAWVTPSPGKDSGHIVWLGSPGWTTLQTLAGGFACFADRNGASRAASGPPATTGQRFHAAAVYRDHAITLFVDGFPFRQQYKIDQKHWVVKGLLTIAGSSDGKPVAEKPMAPFAGIIDQVRVSNFARYDAKFTPPAEFPAGDERDIVCLRFDAGAGTKIRDVSGHERHGELTGGKWVRITKKGQIVASGWHGWPADAPKPAIAPFDAAQAKKYQEEWAAYLKVPVEYENSIGMKFRLIPPGEFLMGSTAEEIEEALKAVGEGMHFHKYIKSESPQHQVILTQPIYLGIQEVTQAQYEHVMGQNPASFAASGSDKQVVAGMDTASCPVEKVSWNDATEFCTKLSQQEHHKPFYFRSGEEVTILSGTGYRLPTEAEWEFSCRAGTTTKYAIGDTENDLKRAAWYGVNSGQRTHMAGELKANPFALYDVHGNVWEWVQDRWNPNFYGIDAVKPAINPLDLDSAGTSHVLRGGYWGESASRCRTTARIDGATTSIGRDSGFRVALPVDAVQQALKPQTNAAWHKWPADAPIPAIAPFDAAQAKKHQEAWAAYLGVPLDYTDELGVVYYLIPPGEFTMGLTTPYFEKVKSAIDTADKWALIFLNTESPAHKVTLTRPFYLATTELNYAQLAHYVELSGAVTDAERDGWGTVVGPAEKLERSAEGKSWRTMKNARDRSAGFLSWNDCQKMAEFLSKQFQLEYRLPTEAEWEYACRAGTTTLFAFGDTLTADQAAIKPSVKPVASFPPNSFGLYDMHGGSREYVADDWEISPSSALVSVDPFRPPKSAYRIGRDGDYTNEAIVCRASVRGPTVPEGRVFSSGVRLALSFESVKKKVAKPTIPSVEQNR